MIPGYRQPVATAQQIASLDRLIRGRLILGIGAGYPSPKTKAAFDIAGADYHRRFTLLDDTTELWRAMWASGATTFHGALLRLTDLPPARAHSQQGPPLWLASGTPQGLRRAARHYDGWLPYPTDADMYAAGWREVTAGALTAARPPAAITPALFATVLVTDDHERGEAHLDAYCRATYGMPSSVVATIQLLLVGHAADIATTLSRNVQAGARHLVIRVGCLDPGDQPERIADALAPVKQHASPSPLRAAGRRRR